MLNILEDYANILMDEAELNAAYTTNTPYRGVLKTTFALTSAKLGLVPSGAKSISQQDGSGFISHLQLNPAPLVLVIVDELTSPASLASAILTAKLAGVPQIIALAPTHSSGVLASLDLSGLSILQTSPQQLAEIIDRLPNTARILNFTPQALATPLLQWQDQPKKLGFTCAKYQDTLHWAQPRAELRFIEPELLQAVRSSLAAASSFSTASSLAASNFKDFRDLVGDLNGLYHELPQVFWGNEILGCSNLAPQAPHFLSLHCPQLAGCWLNLDLTLDFFMNQHLQFEFKEADLDP